jgi:hypothetical protein
VGEWTERGAMMNPQCHPGIWIVRDRLPILDEVTGASMRDADDKALWRPATDDERAEMWEMDLQFNRTAQEAYSLALFENANGIDQDKRLRKFIPREAHLAARYYGWDAEWLRNNGVAVAPKTCIFCAKSIPGTAIKCPHCLEIVDIPAYAAQEAEKRTAVREATTAVR